MSDGKPAPQNIQDAFLNTVRRDKTTVTVYLVNGAKLLGKIRSFDKFSVLLESGSQEQLIFKHAISTISLAKRVSGELRGSPTPRTRRPNLRLRASRNIRLNSHSDQSNSFKRTVWLEPLLPLKASMAAAKSTQLRLLPIFLRAQSCDVLTTREPGGTPVGLRLRAALLDAQEEVDPLTELLVFAADRAQHVRRVLRPAIAAGQIVISDRYADATVAYQGAGRGFSPELISRIVDLATEGLKPDLTLLFDLPVASQARARGAGPRASTKAKRRIDLMPRTRNFTAGFAELIWTLRRASRRDFAL